MGRSDGAHKFYDTADEYHEEHEDINMRGRSINLKTICMNQSSDLKYAINMECLYLQ